MGKMQISNPNPREKDPKKVQALIDQIEALYPDIVDDSTRETLESIRLQCVELDGYTYKQFDVVQEIQKGIDDENTTPDTNDNDY